MPKYEQIAIIRAHFEERGILTVPLIEHLFDEVAALVKLKTDWSLVSLTAGVTFHPQFHPVLIVARTCWRRCAEEWA